MTKYGYKANSYLKKRGKELILSGKLEEYDYAPGDILCTESQVLFDVGQLEFIDKDGERVYLTNPEAAIFVVIE